MSKRKEKREKIKDIVGTLKIIAHPDSKVLEDFLEHEDKLYKENRELRRKVKEVRKLIERYGVC